LVNVFDLEATRFFASRLASFIASAGEYFLALEQNTVSHTLK